MLRYIGNKSLAAAVGAVLLGAVGCTVDTVVYERHPRERTVIVEDAPPEPVDQEVVVVDEPPPAIVEVRTESPGDGYIWVDGSYVRRGGRYVWVRGYWGRPPYGHSHWIAPHWEHRDRGYIRIEGRWE